MVVRYRRLAVVVVEVVVPVAVVNEQAVRGGGSQVPRYVGKVRYGRYTLAGVEAACNGLALRLDIVAATNDLHYLLLPIQ